MSDATNPGSDQWLRKISLIVSSGSDGLDLSELQIQFSTIQSDSETPNTSLIRIFNLSDDTSQQIQKEFTRVTLQAGYQKGAFGIIFDGTIKQVRRGRLDNMNTYLDIYAADADVGVNFGVVSKSLAAGATPKQQAAAYAEAMGTTVDTDSYGVGDPTLIRGKALYGMARSGLRTLARSTGTTWSLQNGKVVIIPLTGYLPGDAVVLNSNSGMIGLPEQTEEGIEVTCLLNPKIQIGTQVQINNASIQTPLASQNIIFAERADIAEFQRINLPKIAFDGFYRVLVCEHEGDTRAQPWYSKLTCLTVNKTVAPNQSVKKFG